MKVYGLLESAGVENLAANPTPAFRGRMYFNTVSKAFLIYDGAAWTSVTGGLPFPTITGSRGSPVAITAAGGITPSLGDYDETIYIVGSPGAVTVSANPQLAAGDTLGSKLELVGRDAANTVLLQDGTGLSLNGAWLAELDSVLGLRWDGTNWVERFRR